MKSFKKFQYYFEGLKTHVKKIESYEPFPIKVRNIYKQFPGTQEPMGLAHGLGI